MRNPNGWLTVLQLHIFNLRSSLAGVSIFIRVVRLSRRTRRLTSSGRIVLLLPVSIQAELDDELQDALKQTTQSRPDAL